MSDFTDKVDDDRCKEIHYNTFIASSKEELKGYEGRKKEIVLEGAKILESRGYDSEKISSKLGDDLEGFITRRYIREVLGDEYKDIKKRNVNKEPCGTVPHQDQKKPLLITNDGQVQTDEDNKEAIDRLAEAKVDAIIPPTHKELLLKKRADEELDEDMEETLENPHNVVPKRRLISDDSPEQRDKIARLAEMEEALKLKTELAEHETKQHAKWLGIAQQYRVKCAQLEKQVQQPQITVTSSSIPNKSSSSDLVQKLQLENTKLKEILDDKNKQAEIEDNFERLGIYKLQSDKVLMLQKASRDTHSDLIYLYINRKTGEIVEAITSTEHKQRELRKEYAKNQQEMTTAT